MFGGTGEVYCGDLRHEVLSGISEWRTVKIESNDTNHTIHAARYMGRYLSQVVLCVAEMAYSVLFNAMFLLYMKVDCII